MKKLFSTFLLLPLWLGACATVRALPIETNAAQSVAVIENVIAETNATQPSVVMEINATEAPTLLGRRAVITQIENAVSMRTTISAELLFATEGMVIFPNGRLETGANGRARLDLLPDGTIVRVGPSTVFSISEITTENGQPKTTLDLLFGEVYILLNGGTLEVTTPTGVASVRGSVLSVEYDPKTQRVKAACLEGHCALGNGKDVEVKMTQGETSYIDAGKAPVAPEAIDSEEIQEWLDEVPELPDFFETLPNPNDFPKPKFNGGDNDGGKNSGGNGGGNNGSGNSGGNSGDNDGDNDGSNGGNGDGDGNNGGNGGGNSGGNDGGNNGGNGGGNNGNNGGGNNGGNGGGNNGGNGGGNNGGNGGGNNGGGNDD